MKIIKKHLNYSKAYASFDFSSLKIGDILTLDIYIKRDKLSSIVIEAGTTLSNNLYNKLKKQESLYISKKDEAKQVLTCQTLKYYIKFNQKNSEKSLQLLYDVTNRLFDSFLASKDNEIDLFCIEEISKSIIFLAKCDDNFIKNTMPFFINDNRLSVHSLHVAIYAVNIGNLLNYNENRLLQLAMAAFLIDTGLKKINKHILNKETTLNQVEIDLVSKHVQYSVEIAKHNHVSEPYIIDAIVHHHERYDGSGYPQRQKSGEISEFASILAICDVFDAMTINRPYRKEHTSFNALTVMIKDPVKKNQFNQEYLHLFLKSL